MTTAILAVLLVGALVALFLLWRQNKELTEKYAPIIDAHGEVRRAREEADRLRASAKTDADGLRAATKTEMEALRSQTMAELATAKQQRAALSTDYADARALYDRLKAQIALLEENVEDISVGLYKPHYKYDSSDNYKEALDLIREQQKALVKGGKAAICGHTWHINGDYKEGAKMTKEYLKLVLRAFNGECDAAVARVSWNNVTKMEERIRKTYDGINELGRVMQMRITPDYCELKIAELRLEYETERKKHEEKEEQRRIREQMREEERALREAEKARQEAEEEEARYQKALEKAKAELAKAKGDSLDLLKTKIEQLDAALHKAREMKDKANSMAQLTRSGYVYIISNAGSFGDNVFKIGMTRRLDPMDRVWELSDASVPFDFDVHAMVYSTDAPTLEGTLQQKFRDASLNLINPRKEFFAVSIDQIEAFVQEKGLNVELTKLAEAREFRETQARRAEMQKAMQPIQKVEEFPASV